ncbi:hypothetical protein G7Y89_g15423 [Cudoniella acicularis]|uniref:Uncharacterized protein n=1 Tax=Cudoniella acicularis TaxID=354080 RepID=A0A8H4QP08_9HELO|nr:hypothetical protein G7Y89_g15423 [Cudoniella acicularis]
MSLLVSTPSGNDFKFADVVLACVYNYGPTGDAAKDATCNTALSNAAAIIGTETVWNTYKDKVNKIFSDVSITKDYFNMKWSVLVIIGYAKFFGKPDNNDACSKTRFPIPFALMSGQGNLMNARVRATMNTLVDTSESLPSKGNGDGDLIPGLPNELQQNSVFHPKTAGHASTAAKVKQVVDDWSKENGHNEAPPPQVCDATDAPNIPSKIISIPGLIGPPQEVVEPNGLLAKIREVLCGNRCKIPDNMDSRPGAILTGDGGRCETSLGVQGGSEAYMLRDRSISGADQTQHCWDSTLALINTYVNNGANEGWRGVDPSPAFYQTGYRKLNSGKHDTISQDRLLQKLLEC